MKLEEIAALEKEIEKKFGKKAVQNPKAGWDEDKEKKYAQETKELKDKIILKNKKDKPVTEEQDGFLVESKLIKTEKSERNCPVCDVFSFNPEDDYYMDKYTCCRECFYLWVDGREERWLSGWRPKKEFENG